MSSASFPLLLLLSSSLFFFGSFKWNCWGVSYVSVCINVGSHSLYPHFSTKHINGRKRMFQPFLPKMHEKTSFPGFVTLWNLWMVIGTNGHHIFLAVVSWVYNIIYIIFLPPPNLCDLNLIKGKSGNLSWITFFLISGLHSSLLWSSRDPGSSVDSWKCSSIKPHMSSVLFYTSDIFLS